MVIAVDGVIEEQMVRFRNLSPQERDELSTEVTYENWMGSRHMSALETSARSEVIATITLSEEDGRVSVFQDGTAYRDEIGDPCRAN